MHTLIIFQETKHRPCDGRDDGAGEQGLEECQHDLAHQFVPSRGVRLLEKEIAEIDDENEDDICDDDEGQEKGEEEARMEMHV
jgi:hypothetical protein